MATNIQLYKMSEKVFPRTIPSAVIIERNSSIYTLDNVLDDIDVIKNANGQTFTFDEKMKLSNIEDYANKYIHPDKHDPSIIEQNQYNRFVTETQISNWDAIANNLSTITDGNLDASKVYTDQRIAALVNGAQGTLDTLNELAGALGNDVNFSTTVATQLGLKATTDYVDTKLIDKYDKSGGQIYGQVLSSIGQSKGIKFDTSYLTSIDGTNLALFNNADGFRFTDVEEYSLDRLAGLKFINNENTIYFGGPAGTKFNDAGNPFAISVDMTLNNSGVQNVVTTHLISEEVNTPILAGKITDTSTYRIKTDSATNSVEFATGDINNAKVIVRQYTDSSFGTILRSLTLLDNNGNTILPGNLTVNGGGIFTGTVTVPTLATTINDLRVANTAFVHNLLTSKSIKLSSLKSTGVFTADTITVPLNLVGFDNTNDQLLVFLNGMILTEDEYVLNTNVSISAIDPLGFKATTSDPAVFNFVVIKASFS